MLNARVSLLATVLLTVVRGALVACDQDNKCPESSPCCSAYGQCGLGAYCLGGCDPRSSFSLKSCTPKASCKSEDFSFSNLDGMQANSIYLGDSSNANWVTEGTPVPYHDESVLLTMPESTVGTLLASTHYVWYGKISATMKTSAGQGVVTAFIMMSDVKDEIDFEFIGNDLNAAQANFYWQGVANYSNMEPLVASSTNTEWHTYTIDWQEDKLTWLVDDQPLRTLERSATIDPTTGEAKYPQTPARIMISLWPAGLPTTPEGTREWAGGLIDWASPYMQNGYYFAQIKDVTIECADPPSSASGSGDNFVYKDYTGSESSIEFTDDSTVLGSFYASGENQNFDPNPASGTDEPDATPTDVQTIPGVVGGGQRGGTDGAGDEDNDTLSGGGNGLSDGADLTTFDQGLGNTAGGIPGNQAVRGSVLAFLVAFVALVHM